VIDLCFAEKLGAKNEQETAFLVALMEASRSGHLCLDLTTASETVKLGAETFGGSPYLHRFDNLVYLQRNWVYETRILEHVRRLLASSAPLSYHSPELNPQQQAAVTCALSHDLSIITGGPGTGKTFIARHLIQAMGPNAKVLLAAPTGKAAARLQELNRNSPCTTLHALLGIRSERDLLKEGSYVHADLIVVDESSMIDVRLLSYFLASVHKGTRVVLMGDSDQLPPVESGSLFADLVDLIPTARLTQSLRSDSKEILELASRIREGQWVGDFTSSFDLWGEIAGKSWEDFRILSCVREGPWGVNTLNQMLYDRFKGTSAPIPIMITRTDYTLGLYNGETGVLKNGEAVFSDKNRTFAAAALPPYEYAYCLSVHKSQGSEFNDVLLLVPPGSEVFGREMLYTGATRARRSVKVCADPDTLQKTLAHVSRKRSGLRERFLVER
jgi:exodeoxyribonuclease V alpha subunit